MKSKKISKISWITGLAIVAMMLCGLWWTSVKGTALEEADLSKGVTYGDNIINLNGNSVVITDSDNSTDTNQLCNIYLDTNRNGQIDAGEEKVSLPNVTGTEIPASIPIYGIYKQRSNTPISITILSGYHNIVYGVYEGELDVEDSEETACRIHMQGGQVAGELKASVNSKIITSSSTAAAITIKDSNINVIQGISGGEVITGESARTAVDISITGDTVFQSSSFSNEYPILSGADIQGDVVMDIHPEITSNIDRFYGLSEGTSVDGSLSVAIDHLSIKNVLYLTYAGCTVTGDVSLISGEELYSPNYFLTYNTSVTGDVTAALYGKMQNSGAGSDTLCRIIDGGSVGGNVDITIKDGAFSQFSGAQNATVAGKVTITLMDGTFGQVYGIQSATVKGNVDISFEAGTYSSYTNGIDGSSAVEGDVTLTSGEKAVFTKDFRGCLDGSKIGGSVTVDIYNANTSNANTFQAVGAANVAGEITAKLHGGTWENVYGINTSPTYQYLDNCRIEFENVTASRMIGIKEAVITGDATVVMTACETKSLDMRGIDGGRVTGDASVTMTACTSAYYLYGISYATIDGNAGINMNNAGCSKGYDVCGAYSVEYGPSITVDMANCTTYSLCGTYKVNTAEADGDVTVTIRGCTVTNVNGVYDSSSITGAIDVSIQDCAVSDTMYGIRSTQCKKDATVRTANNQTKNFVGMYSGTISGSATVITDGDNADHASEGYYYGLQYSTVNEDVSITTKDCKYQDYTGVVNATCHANAEITVDGGTYSGSVIQPFGTSVCYMDETSQATVVFKNASFTSDSADAVISNCVSFGTLTMTIEDSCIVNDSYEIYPLWQGGADALLTYQNDYYFAGSYPITEDINARNIYFGKMEDVKAVPANILIPEGITVTAEEKLYIPNCGSLLIEGALNGDVNLENDNYQQGAVYMNGGVMEAEELMNKRFYPLMISYKKKGGIITTDGDTIRINSLRPEQYFGLVDGTPAVTCTAKKGYTLTDVTVTKDGSVPQVLTANEDNEYSFDMEACPAELAITFTGIQITLDKTEASLTTRLYEETTAGAPLYDMTAIEISNDGEEGDVTYEPAEEQGLPKGLELVDGKLFGVPEQAFEDGTDVVVQITGRNDTIAEFTLHIVVMAGDEDGNPIYRIPKDLTASYGDTLGDVSLPSDENGAFLWQDEENTSVGNAGEHEFLVTYTPTNKKYQTVTDIPIILTVNKAKVEFARIEELNAVYKNTLADLILPEAEGGEYQWIDPLTTELVDKTAYQLSFAPDDTDNYDWAAVEGWDEEKGLIIWPVLVHVEKLEPSISKAPISVNASCGMTLSQIELPLVKDGIWYWKGEELTAPAVSASELPDGILVWNEQETVLTVGEAEHNVSYIPEDTDQYKTVTDIPMTVSVEHLYKEGWETDDTSHWHACVCGDTNAKAEHTWNDGVVTKEATATEDGEKQYTCTVCNMTRTEVIKAVGGTGDTSQNPPQVTDSQNPGQTGTTGSSTSTETQGSVPAAGTVLTDSVTKAKYKVTSKAGEEPAVMYLSSTNPSATTLSITANVTIDGISYKVTAIADNAFKNNKKLKKITIGASIITIGNSAFSGCTALTTVKMGNGVEKIGNKAFYGCKKLSSLTLGANVTTLGSSIFYKCIALKKVTIPKKVKKIGSKAFYGCKKLVSITIKTTKLTTKNVGSKAFTKAGSSNYKKLTVKVPKKKLKAYKKLLKKKGLNSKAKVRK